MSEFLITKLGLKTWHLPTIPATLGSVLGLTLKWPRPGKPLIPAQATMGGP